MLAQLFHTFDIMAQANGAELGVDRIRQFPSLIQKFVYNVLDLAVELFGKNPDSAAVIFFGIFLNRTFNYNRLKFAGILTGPAKVAVIFDLSYVVYDFDGTKRTNGLTRTASRTIFNNDSD